MDLKTLLLISSFFLVFGCGPKPSDQGSETSSTKLDSTHLDDSQAGQASEDELLSKGLPASSNARRMAFSLDTAFPILYDLVKENQEVLEDLTHYARAISSGSVQNEEELLSLIEQRETNIIPSLDPLLAEMDEMTFYEKAKALIDELAQLGIQVATVEGMYGALVPGEMKFDQMESMASDPFKLYLKFEAAYGNSVGGEYTYSDMEPYRQMVLIGEQMMTQFPESPYYQKIEDKFRQALREFTGVFLQRQQDYNVPIVGGPLGYSELSLTEVETHKAFVEENTDSRYHPVIADMVEQLSAAAMNPENLYVILLEWQDTQENALAKQYEYLDAGTGILHILKVKKGNGEDHFALVYRFFDEDALASKVYEEIADKWEEARMIMVSVNKGELYQLGI